MDRARLKITYRNLTELKSNPRNARTHSKAQLKQIAASISRFGMVTPVGVDDGDELVFGHARVAAAKMAGLDSVPVVKLSHLSRVEQRAYLLADNRLALNAGWDQALLADALRELSDLNFELPALGFSIAEIDTALSTALASAEEGEDTDDGRENLVPPLTGHAVSKAGDLWNLGRHRLLCGDAREPAAYAVLLGSEKAGLIFTDPPYNVQIAGNVSGLGRLTHREFAMASGEMSEADYTAFLEQTLGAACAVSRDGAIAFVCMDWRHMGDLIEAGKRVFSELKNVCVWNKKVAGMGTFYRSKHEMVLVFKVGTAPHTNSFGLGDTGRYRTNVWDYAGVTGNGNVGKAELMMHPTVKPTALVMDAIKDCSTRGEIVLDPFAGSGTTLIAAEGCGRKARLIEYDPIYCDTIIRRYQALTGKQATLADDGSPFEDVENECENCVRTSLVAAAR